MENKEFHTFNDYMKKRKNKLTPSMEDYLEMIYRLSEKNGFTRVNELANSLNIQPPSATKMVQKLAEEKLLIYEKYGVIVLEEEGKQLGKYLLKRHKIIERFLQIIGIDNKNILDETEKIEHTISEETALNIGKYIEFLEKNDWIIKEYYDFIKLNKI